MQVGGQNNVRVLLVKQRVVKDREVAEEVCGAVLQIFVRTGVPVQRGVDVPVRADPAIPGECLADDGDVEVDRVVRRVVDQRGGDADREGSQFEVADRGQRRAGVGDQGELAQGKTGTGEVDDVRSRG